MIERDYLLRQIHQLIAVLAQVLLRKQEGPPGAAQQALATGIESALGMPLGVLRSLGRTDLLALCAEGGTPSGEKMVALADLLREDERADGRARALWLYEEALLTGAAVPLDVHARIDALRAGKG